MTTTSDLIRQDANHINECDVTSLRQEQAITVRMAKPNNRPFSTARRRSKHNMNKHVMPGRLSTSCHENSPNTQQQLPLVLKPLTLRKDTEKTVNEGPCCCNYHEGRSTLIPSIRRQTSTPFRHLRTSLAAFALPKFKDHFIVVFIFILSLIASCAHAASSSSKPLTRTDGELKRHFFSILFLLLFQYFLLLHYIMHDTKLVAVLVVMKFIGFSLYCH